LLLDTHIALWAVTGDDNLNKQALSQIESSQCFVSHAALWEIAIKHSLGKRTSDAMPFSSNDALIEFELAGFELLKIDVRHIRAVESTPHHHRDPFDRLMIAQAQVEQLTLATRDRRLPAYGAMVMPL
jgi:PIN domain nuclease of toxin-antitoxin system